MPQQSPERRPPVSSDAIIADAHHGVDPGEAGGPQDGASDEPAGDGAGGGQDDRDAVAAVEQDLEGLDVVGDDGPAEAARRRGHVVVPDHHQDREQLRRRADQQRRRHRVRPRAGAQDPEEHERREGRRRQEPDAEVEGQRREGAEDHW